MFEVTNWKLMWSDMLCAVPLFFSSCCLLWSHGGSSGSERLSDWREFMVFDFWFLLPSLTKGFCFQAVPCLQLLSNTQGWEEKCAFQGGFKATYSLWHGVENFIPLEWPAWTYINDMFPWHSQVKEKIEAQAKPFWWYLSQTYVWLIGETLTQWWWFKRLDVRINVYSISYTCYTWFMHALHMVSIHMGKSQNVSSPPPGLDGGL